MFKFNNPFDVSKDGQNSIIDGIRYNIRNSENIKEQVKECLKYIEIDMDYINSPLEILELALDKCGYNLDELIISDEHELLDEIQRKFYW